MTQFSKLTTQVVQPKQIKKTVFTYVMGFRFDTGEPYMDRAMYQPEHFTEVIYLGRHSSGHDMFKAVSIDGITFGLYLGQKGDEFKN